MAKVTSLQGKATGKVGAVVYSVNSGVQIAREYNPTVKNPNTDSQVQQRSRLKLASQLAAALAPVIAIPREGLVTPRNAFIKKNMIFISAVSSGAQISYENIQLTSGVTGLPAITATRTQDGRLVVSLTSDASKSVSRVVYIFYRKTSENQLQFVDSLIETIPGDDGKFKGEIVDFDGDIIIWAYGIKDSSAKASANYGNYDVFTGEDIAKLVISRKISSGDYQFTQTRGVTIFDNAGSTIDAGENEVMIYITAEGPGVVDGDGFTGNRKAVAEGGEVKVHAVPDINGRFVGWRINGETSYVSLDADYTFAADGSKDLVAVFETNDGPNG